MICPKCKKENQRGRFCGYCGHQLKELCKECKEWESIGRPVCLKKVKKVKTKLEERVLNVGLTDHMIFGMIIWISLMTIIIGSTTNIRIQGFTLVIFSFISLIGTFVVCSLEKKRIKKAKEKFFTEYPDYKEILKKNKRKS